MANNIMVFDVAAEDGGALTILEEYYNKAQYENDKKWYFVVSLPILEEIDNIKILRFPWIKKSWIHRLCFDYFIAPRIIKKYKPVEIISLQNVIIPRTKVPQTLYVHQPLPFVKKKFRLRDSYLLWIYQNIIGKMIFRSIKKANKIIVQTKWMAEACIAKTKVKYEKIFVMPPQISVEIKEYFKPTKESLQTFFYPASGLIYKNHKLIVEAVKILKRQGISEYKMVFTLTGDENKNILDLYEQIEENKLPIEFIGSINRCQVFNYYTRSILIFPSYIETFGLPLLEAKVHRTPILASDCHFSHEILEDYINVKFFNADDANELAGLIKNRNFQ